MSKIRKRVTIPTALIDKLNVVDKGEYNRFLKVQAPIDGDPHSGKGAVEKNWKDKLYKADDPTLQAHLDRGGNYGYALGRGLGGVDLDTKNLCDKFEAKVNTFTILSGSGMDHALIRTDCGENGTINRWNPDKKDSKGNKGCYENIGNIQYDGKLLVGPNSNHYTGSTYKIKKDLPIAFLSKKELDEIFGPELVWTSSAKQLGANEGVNLKRSLGCDVPLEDFVDLTSLSYKGNGEYQGSHPVHGSEGGNNFSVNTEKQCYNCYRCNSGGNVIKWIAVKEGWITCDQAIPGQLLNPKVYQKVIKLLKERGYKIKNKKSEKEHPADRLIKLVNEKQVELFHDQYNEAFARVPDVGHLDGEHADSSNRPKVAIGTIEPTGFNSLQSELLSEKGKKIIEKDVVSHCSTATIATRNLPIRSEAFKSWLQYVYWQTFNTGISRDSVSIAIGVLSAKAICEGKQYYLYNRVAYSIENDQQVIWLDIADKNNQAIKITVNGWEVIPNPPILFRRFPHQKPLILPDPSATVQDAWRILDFMNIDNNPDNRLIIMATIISYLVPNIAHPLLMVSGPHGSCKSYLGTLIKKAIDPSITELLEVPRDRAELILQLEQHWLPIHDNLTLIPSWMSEAYCRAITGAGQMKRKLYTDGDTVLAQFKRPIIINGINPGATKADLLDRSIPIVTPPMTIEKRKEESVLINQFNAALPRILGGFLAVLVEAMKIYPDVKQNNLQRLADFHKWGIAIAIALGKSQSQFNEAYAEKVRIQLDEALNADNIALLITNFAETHVKGTITKTLSGDRNDYWESDPTTFYSIIKGMASPEEQRSKDFPKSVNKFTRRMNMASPSLHAIGIEVGVFRTTGGRRRVFVDAENFVVEEQATTSGSTVKL